MNRSSAHGGKAINERERDGKEVAVPKLVSSRMNFKRCAP